jgi:hypothetical protein
MTEAERKLESNKYWEVSFLWTLKGHFLPVCGPSLLPSNLSRRTHTYMGAYTGLASVLRYLGKVPRIFGI